jgi:hypothetical protein
MRAVWQSVRFPIAMNDIAKVARSGRRQVVTLPDGVDVLAGEMRVRVEGRRLVLEPLDMEPPGVRRIAPGHYTPETLPALSEGARRILESVDSAAAKSGAAGSAEAAGAGIEEEGIGIELSDEGLPGLDPGD